MDTGAICCRDASHSHKHIFDVHKLDLQKTARLRFAVPPKVNLNFKFTGKGVKEGNNSARGGNKRSRHEDKARRQLGNMHVFSANNPHEEVRRKSDKRQFGHRKLELQIVLHAKARLI